MARRCSCASRSPITSSTGLWNAASIHKEKRKIEELRLSAFSKSKCLTIICIQVVPDLREVDTTRSSFRGLKCSHLVASR